MREITITIRKATEPGFEELYKIYADSGRRPLPLLENCYVVTFDNPKNEKTGRSTWTISKEESIGQLVDDIKRVTGEL